MGEVRIISVLIEQLLLGEFGDQRADLGIQRGGGGRRPPQIGQQIRAQHFLAADGVPRRRLLREGVEFRLRILAGFGQAGVGSEAGGQQEGLARHLRVQELQRLGAARGGGSQRSRRRPAAFPA